MRPRSCRVLSDLGRRAVGAPPFVLGFDQDLLVHGPLTFQALRAHGRR